MKSPAAVVLTIITYSVSAAAQVSTPARGGVLSFAEGEVTVGAKTISAGAQSIALHREQSITTRAGRAELLLNPCIVFHLAENSAVRVIGEDSTEIRLDLTSGSALIRADGILRNTTASVSIGENMVPLTDRGVYRFVASPPRLSVFQGKAEVRRPGMGPLKLTSGRMAELGSTAAPVRFKADQQADDFGRWSLSRAVALLLESGYNEAAERDREQRERAWKQAEAAGRLPAGTPPPRSMGVSQGRLRFCAEASVR